MTEKSTLKKRKICAAKIFFCVIKSFVAIHLDIDDLVY